MNAHASTPMGSRSRMRAWRAALRALFRPRPAARPARRFIPAAGPLEDRTVPAALGAFTPDPQVGSLVYEATAAGSLGTVAVADGFESGDLGPDWATYSSDPAGRIQVTGDFGTAAGTFALLMDTQEEGIYNLNEAVWHVHPAGPGGSLLRFSHAVYNDEPEPLAPGAYTGHQDADGVSVSPDGVTWYPAWSPDPDQPVGTWQEYTVDLAAAAGGGLNPADFFVKFQQYDNFPLDTDGRGYDEVAVIGPGPADVTTFTADPGQTIGVTVTGAGSLRPAVQLLSGGVVVGSATAPAAGGAATVPVVRVPGQLSGGPGTAYQIVVGGVGGNLGSFATRVVLNAVPETGAANDTPAGAQPLGPAFVMLHSAGGSGVQPSRAAVLGTTDASPFGGELDEQEVNDPGPVQLPNAVDFAQALDGAGWNLGDDGDIADATTVPHISVEGTGDFTFDYYTFTVPAAGARGVFDIDHETSNFGDPFLDTMLFLYDANRTLLAASDDYFGDDSGSNTFLASYIDYTFADPGTYVIAVAQYFSFDIGGLVDGTPLFDGDAYTLQVSVEGHALNPGGADPLAEVEPNQPDLGNVPPPDYTAFAQDLDPADWVVNTDPTFINPQTVPHLTVHGTGDGSFDYYTFTVPAGGGDVFAGPSPDTLSWGAVAFLFDANGTVLAATDGFGPFGATLPGGTYAIGVGTYGSGVFAGRLTGPAPQPGDTYDLYVSVEGHPAVPTTPDLYAFDLRGGDSAAVAATPTGDGAVTVEVVNAAGAVLATGAAGPTNVGAAVPGFVAPASGTYYVRVAGAAAGQPYNLVVTRNAGLDLEGNDTRATARPVTAPQVGGRRWVLGAIDSGTRVFDAVDSGWYDNTGSHNPANTNYFAGLGVIAGSARELRDFFVFDVPAIDGRVLGAQLRLFNPDGGYASADPTETYAVYDVSTPAGTLTGGGSGLTGVFDDLGTGTSFGSRAVSAADDNTLLTIDLNPAGVAAATAGGTFAVGGALTTLAGNTPTTRVFGFSSAAFPRQLAVTLADADVYQVAADANATLQLETYTPGGGAGAFGNGFDPIVRLYDAAGNLVGSNDNGAADGRNAALSYRVPKGKGGTYYVEVATSPLADPLNHGEYVLSIRGDRAGGPAPGPAPSVAWSAGPGRPAAEPPVTVFMSRRPSDAVRAGGEAAAAAKAAAAAADPGYDDARHATPDLGWNVWLPGEWE